MINETQIIWIFYMKIEWQTKSNSWLEANKKTMTMIHIIVAQQFNNKHKDAIIEIANLNKKKKTQVNQ